MGDVVSRGQALAERLRLHGVVDKDWWEMSALEQDAIARAAEDYDDDVGNEDATIERDELREQLDEIEKSKEGRGIALIEGPDGELDLTFRGKPIDGVLSATVRWDAKNDTRVSLCLRSLDAPVLVDLAAETDLVIETALDEQIALRAKADANAAVEGAARMKRGK
jgi:hypothetical protein